MPKRSLEATEVQTNGRSEGSIKFAALAGPSDSPARKTEEPSSDEEDMGEFEDAWEDEIDDDEDEVIDNAEEDGDGDADAMDVDVQQAAEDDRPLEGASLDTFIPGRHKLSKDEILVADQSTYEMLHHMNVSWPCLSFDVLKDGLGNERSKFPATTYLVAGTQADTAKNNEVMVMKMSQMHRTQKDEDESESDDDEDDEVDEDAVLEYRSIPHLGGVNRIRAQPLPYSDPLPPPSSPYYVASWSETGKVHIFNVRPLMEALDVPGYAFDKPTVNKPVYTSGLHKAEGFAMDWAPLPENSAPRLLTGDTHSKIYLTTANASGFTTSPNPFTSHTSSVEDIQWSPSETTVFASCSADQSIRIWDVRVKTRTSVLAIQRAHDSDVNVISWNRCPNASYLLASGGDEGGLKVWDLRSLKSSASTAPSPVASFTWHTAPITSLEWHPSEDSAFVASGADDQVTIWDLAVEHDEDEAGSQGGLRDVPPQLLFVHQGQRDIKEVHWCRQMPGTVVSTASDGFNVFKTISI